MSGRTIKIGSCALAALALLAYLVVASRDIGDERRSPETYDHLNRNLSVAGVQLYETQERLLERLGDGTYADGFGGFGRSYADKRLTVGFSNDPDNDFYLRVGQLEFSNPAHAVYGIQVGHPVAASILALRNRGYERVAENVYRNGEYAIQLYGDQNIESIKIWFDDQDLRDRRY